MSKLWKQTPDRHGHRAGNSEYKYLLKSLGFHSTRTSYLKEWISNRIHCNNYIASDEFPVKICYRNMVGSFKTWAQACYEIALIERRESKK